MDLNFSIIGLQINQERPGEGRRFGVVIKGSSLSVLKETVSVHSEMVDFCSGQGRSDFETADVARLRRGFQKSENTGLGRKMPFMDGH